MPRKKSAAKKAKEIDVSADIPIQDSLFEEVDEADDLGFTINEEYAKRFEHNKKREDLHRLQEKYKDTGLENDDDDSTSEEEDDIGDLNTPQIDAAIFKILAKIRNKDEDLYTAEVKFFEEAEKAAATTTATRVRQVKPTRIADVHRQTLLSGKANIDHDGEDSDGEMEPEENMTHAQEQDALRNAFHGIGEEADSDDEILVPRKKNSEEAKEEEEQYQTFLQTELANGGGEDLLAQLKSSNADNPEGEEFLMNYVLNRGWIDKDAGKVPSYDTLQDVDSEEEFAEWEDRAEKFETNYNFRFEQPGATEITTHPRDVQSVRRKDEKRKKEREGKINRENAAKQERLEDLNRLRNLKKAEFEEKIRKIEEVTGRPMDFDQLDLEGDFDPDQWDKKMLERFNDEYYGEEEKKPTWDDDIDVPDFVAQEEESDQGSAAELDLPSKKKSSVTKPTKREEKSRKRKVEALVDAAVPEVLGPAGRKFRYRQSEPETFGLSVEDILFADDKDLNEFVGLKKLAAFKPAEKLERDRKKYGAKKRVKQFQKTLWSQSKWSQRTSGPNEIEIDGGRGSRKKSKTKAVKES